MDLELVDLQSPIDEQARQLSAACETTGFFRIPLSAIDRNIADHAWETARQFFALPEQQKRQVEFPQPGYPYGYAPFKYETLTKSMDASSPSAPDLKESLSVGPDCAGPVGPASEAEAWIRSPSLWPDDPAGLRNAWTAYYRALADVAECLMAAMAVALDLPANYFAPMLSQPITSMRALHYPELTDESILPDAHGPSGSLRAGAHSDYGTLTILRTDGVEGLEIQASDQSWIAVEPQPDTFVVNLGDSIAQWTNDRWRSTIHRVALTDTAPRQSFAFFHMANWDAVIECLPTCVPAGAEPRHAPTQAGPWLMSKFQSTVL